MLRSKGETQTERRLRLALRALDRIANMSDLARIERAKSIAENALKNDQRRRRNCPEHGSMLLAEDGDYFCTACSAED
jgi:hypothetical protein